MIEAIDEGNRLVTIGSSGLSDFEQSQMIIALDTLFGLQIPLIDGDPAAGDRALHVEIWRINHCAGAYWNRCLG